MLTLLLLLSAQDASADFDTANLKMVQCYFEVVRGSSADAAAAELDRLMARTCSAEEAAFRKAAQSRIRAS